ncbi:MAG TPA: hypothetical protein VGD59_00415 [Acidisarcina sp.]
MIGIGFVLRQYHQEMSLEPPRKYVTEFAINMVGLGVVLLTQEYFSSLETLAVAQRLSENPCHIYIIARRPRVLFDADAFVVDSDSISGRYLLQEGLSLTPYPFTLSNHLGESDLRIKCPYPHTAVTIYSALGERLHHSQASLFVSKSGPEDLQSKLALEVVYVGQAFGTDGVRTAPDRLKSHSTLQAIYSEAISRSPDKEIWLSLWNFESRLFANIDGRSQNYLSTDEADDEHIYDVLSTEIEEQQQINFTEAALIKYFQPQYNVRFKINFPSQLHRSYLQCYDLDIHSLIVEVNTEHFGASLWSSTVTPNLHHLITFTFHSSAERRALFDLLV